jgi:hypothetical protein
MWAVSCAAHYGFLFSFSGFDRERVNACRASIQGISRPHLSRKSIAAR